MSHLRIFNPANPPESLPETQVKPPASKEANPVPSLRQGPRPVLHRIAQVRQRQAISLKSVADSMNIDMREARDQEQPQTDLSLSDIYRWQKALSVSLPEILLPIDRVDRDNVSTTEATIKLAKQLATQLQATVATQEGLELADKLVDLLSAAESESENLDRWTLVQMLEELDQSNLAT